MAAAVKVYVHVPGLARFDYGAAHPFRLERLEATHRLIEACGLLDRPDVSVVEPEPAGRADLLLWHRPEFIEALERAGAGKWTPADAAWGLGTPDNPVFTGIYRYCLLYAGATLAAARAVVDGARASFNIAGGLHHAHAGRASGFCYVNDIVLGILLLLRRYRRVMYVDIDAHHGDGVQEAFYESDRVLTFSLHESGNYLFPGTGFEDESGEGEGEGFTLNFPFLPGAGDDIYRECFEEVFGAAAARFRPEAFVLQLGADSLAHDPLAHLALSNAVPAWVTGMVMATGTPLVALGGGGYDIDQVARAWTLAWAAMVGADPDDELPDSYLRSVPGRARRSLRDGRRAAVVSPAAAIEEARRVKRRLLAEVVPLIHDRGGAGGNS